MEARWSNLPLPKHLNQRTFLFPFHIKKTNPVSCLGTIAIFRGRPDHAGVLTRLRNIIRQVENQELSHDELLENLNDAADVMECIYINEVSQAARDTWYLSKPLWGTEAPIFIYLTAYINDEHVKALLARTTTMAPHNTIKKAPQKLHPRDNSVFSLN